MYFNRNFQTSYRHYLFSYWSFLSLALSSSSCLMPGYELNSVIFVRERSVQFNRIFKKQNDDEEEEEGGTNKLAITEKN